MEQDNKKFGLISARLSDLERGKVFAFCQDKEMMHAVEKVLTYSLYMMGTIEKEDAKIHDVNWAFGLANMDDEKAGRELKARVTGLSYLDDAFQQLKKFNVAKKEEEEEPNQAR